MMLESDYKDSQYIPHFNFFKKHQTNKKIMHGDSRSDLPLQKIMQYFQTISHVFSAASSWIDFLVYDVFIMYLVTPWQNSMMPKQQNTTIHIIMQGKDTTAITKLV